MATEVRFDDIVRVIREQGWRIGIGPEQTIGVAFAGHQGTFRVTIRFISEKEIILVYVACPFSVAREHIVPVMELAARINWGLHFATCEVQPESGSVRFRASLPVDNIPLFSAPLLTLIATASSLADRYTPAFAAVIGGTHTPAAIIAEIESTAFEL